MMRLFDIGRAVTLAVALLAQSVSTADAAGNRKSPKKGGFTPDQAATMTAIALAESKSKKGLKEKGGQGKASGGEDSWGLWQINGKAPKGGKSVKSK
jgi:hypothetical protein